MLELKLKQILKNEISNLIIFSIVPILLIPFIIWFIDRRINQPDTLNLIAFSILYLFLLLLVIRESLIVRQLKWSIINYKVDVDSVHQFLKGRKKTLDSSQFHENLNNLYDEALKILKTRHLKQAT